jgi:drug/metabolite transporter (DMT)-like permease
MLRERVERVPVSQRDRRGKPIARFAKPGLVPDIHFFKTARRKDVDGGNRLCPGFVGPSAASPPKLQRRRAHLAEPQTDIATPMSLLAKISTTADERSARLAGIGLMLLSIFMFSFGDALGKFLVATHPVGQLLWLRACAALLVLSPMIWRHRAAFMRLERPQLQLLRVTFSTLDVAAFFLATVYLPLADVITYYLASPIFVTALSPLVLGEHVGWRRWSAVLAGFCGVLIALHPSAQTVSWPAMIALGGSLSFAMLMLTTRSLRATPDIVLASSQFAGTFLFGGVLSPFGWVTPNFGNLFLFAAAGCISVAALLCVNRSLKLAPASVVVPYQYSMIVWAVMFGYLVFSDVPSTATIAGAAIIIGAGLYIFLRERNLGRGEAEVSPPV